MFQVDREKYEEVKDKKGFLEREMQVCDRELNELNLVNSQFLCSEFMNGDRGHSQEVFEYLHAVSKILNGIKKYLIELQGLYQQLNLN